jgi:hypothetical protein
MSKFRRHGGIEIRPTKFRGTLERAVFVEDKVDPDCSGQQIGSHLQFCKSMQHAAFFFK